MTGPAFHIWLLMPLAYLGAFASGIRPARWFGSRLLPLVSVAVPGLFLYILPHWWLIAFPAALARGGGARQRHPLGSRDTRFLRRGNRLTQNWNQFRAAVAVPNHSRPSGRVSAAYSRWITRRCPFPVPDAEACRSSGRITTAPPSGTSSRPPVPRRGQTMPRWRSHRAYPWRGSLAAPVTVHSGSRIRRGGDGSSPSLPAAPRGHERAEFPPSPSRAESGHVTPGLNGDRHVLVPWEVPVRRGSFVEEEPAHHKCPWSQDAFSDIE